jgi:hypothetical protein
MIGREILALTFLRHPKNSIPGSNPGVAIGLLGDRPNLGLSWRPTITLRPKPIPD